MWGNDAATMEALFAPDLVVNSPVNMVVSRDNVLARMRSGQISYEENGQNNIEFVGERFGGDHGRGGAQAESERSQRGQDHPPAIH